MNARLLRGLPLFALAFMCVLQLVALLRTPTAYAPARITVQLHKGESLALDRQSLGAPQPGTLILKRDLAGRWLVRGSSSGRPLVIRHADGERRTGTTSLHAGQRFQLGTSMFTVASAHASRVTFTDGTRTWDYDGATLLRDGEPQAPCPGTSLPARLAGMWNSMAPAALSIKRPLHFGGNLFCGNRLPIAGLNTGSASMARSSGALLLSRGAAPLLLYASDAPINLAEKAEVLDGATSVLVGRTRLRIVTTGDALHLQPLTSVALYARPQVELAPQVQWQWRERDLWGGMRPSRELAACVAVLAGLLAGYGALRRQWAVVSSVAGVLVVLAGVAALVMQRLGQPVGAGVSMLISWCALWYALLAGRRPHLLTVTAVLLLATGLLAQLELGLGAADTSWLRHFQRTAALCAIGIPACLLLARLRPARPPAQAQAEWLLLAGAAAAMLALALQVVFGDETGVFELQPVEFAKLALAALTAHCLALGVDTAHAAQGTLRRWLRVIAPALLFLAVLGVALVQVDDYSPLLLLLVWAVAMALAWSLATGRHAAAGAVGAIALAAVLAIAALRGAGPAQVASWGFYADRFLVWLDLAAHPHTGQQLLLGARAIASGGWFGADGWLGLSTLGQSAGDVLRIPAVQDDFAPSFFLNRHGLAWGLALWTLQAAFVLALLQLAARTWQAAASARDFRHAWLARLRCFALAGGAAFVLGHFVLSWGTNLAIFPIMGQPMSFLSAGGSHLLFFICPLLAIGVASAQSLEESESCRSMSNMKP